MKKILFLIFLPFLITGCGQLNPSDNWDISEPTKATNKGKAEWVIFAPNQPYVFTVVPNVGVSAGGTDITVIGQNFISTSTVKINNAPCTPLTVVNSSTITCTLPGNKAGSYGVIVSNNDGSKSSNSHIPYTYQAPIVSSITGDLTGNQFYTNSITVTYSNFIPTVQNSKISIVTNTLFNIGTITPSIPSAGSIKYSFTGINGVDAASMTIFTFASDTFQTTETISTNVPTQCNGPCPFFGFYTY